MRMSSQRKTSTPSSQLNLCPDAVSLQARLNPGCLRESFFLPPLLSLPWIYRLFFWGLFSKEPITTPQTKNELMTAFFALQAILLCVKNVSFYFSSYSGDGSESLDKDEPVFSAVCLTENWIQLAADNWWCSSPSPHSLLQSGQVDFGEFDAKCSLSIAFPQILV